MEKKSVKLKGKDLAQYITVHRMDFNGNGDEFCLAAGYGVEGNDGKLKCNFTEFVQAVSTAVDEDSSFDD